MNLHEAPPAPILAPFVQCFWSVEISQAETSLRPDAILPNGTSNLIFNLSGQPHREFQDETCRRFDELKTRWLSGMHDAAIIVGPTVCTHVVGIRFRPAGLLPFLSVPAGELVRRTVDPDDLWGNDTNHLHQRLLETPSVEARFQLLERWLLGRLNLHAADEGLMRSLATLQRTSGNISIRRLAQMADLSMRHYRRRFEQAVGLTPKRLCRIRRFSKLIEHIGPAAETVDWTALACDCGYYDQAHLIADFREFAGVTPTGYLARRPVVPGFLPVDAPTSLFSNTQTPAPTTMVTV